MSQSDRRPVLVTGGAGFIGSNIADRLAGEGEDVILYDSLARPGVERNLAWLEERHGAAITPVIGDTRDMNRLSSLVGKAKAVFHMAAQVAVTTSFADPRDDFEVNVLGTLNVLEAARRCTTPPPVIFASTNKVYGGLEDLEMPLVDGAYQPEHPQLRAHGINESRPLDFHTPYGCSKGAADQYVLDYARSFGLPTAVLRMSCIYGQRQMGTEDQGWVAHFLISALEGRKIILYGDGHQVRDILDVSDAVDAYLAVWRNIDRLAGRAFNLGGGAGNAVSLRQILNFIADYLERPLSLETSDWRAGDQRYFVADTRALAAATGLDTRKAWREGVVDLADWLIAERSRSPQVGAASSVRQTARAM
jgi:CDP-paratose 2-epimerase